MILYLTLYRHWFNEILKGQKRIEYRDITDYWNKRLSKHYTLIKFTNGYGKHRPSLIIELKKVIANLDTKKYELYLGEILYVNTINPANLVTQGQNLRTEISDIILGKVLVQGYKTLDNAGPSGSD